MSKLTSFINPVKPDRERPPLTSAQIEERTRITQESYLPISRLLCHAFDRLEQALDELTEKTTTTADNDAYLYGRLATSIQNPSLNVLDILKDELTRNVTSMEIDSFF
jgi:hypothetical protein